MVVITTTVTSHILLLLPSVPSSETYSVHPPSSSGRAVKRFRAIGWSVRSTLRQLFGSTNIGQRHGRPQISNLPVIASQRPCGGGGLHGSAPRPQTAWPRREKASTVLSVAAPPTMLDGGNTPVSLELSSIERRTP